MKFAVYVIVVEDSNENADLIAQLPASNVESINDIETEERAIEIAYDTMVVVRTR